MSRNRRSLIKLATQLDYDLTPKQKDADGNYIKRLVPTDYRRKPNTAEGEVQYKPFPSFDDSKSYVSKISPGVAPNEGFAIPKVVSPTMAGAMMAGMGKSLVGNNSGGYFKPDNSGFNILKRQGIIRPLPGNSSFGEGLDNAILSSVSRPGSNSAAQEMGMLDLDKARVRQLAGPNPSPYDLKLAEAIVRKSAESVRQERYNLLSSKDKKAYDAVAKYYGKNPHYSTIFLPGSLSQTWGKQKVGHPDVLYGPRGVGEPVAYDANANVPGYVPGDTSFILGNYTYDKEGNLNKKVLDHPYVRSAADGQTMIQNNFINDPLGKTVSNHSSLPFSTSRFVEIPTDEGYPGSLDITKGLMLNGINVSNRVGEIPTSLASGEDLGSHDPKNSTSFGWPLYNLDVLDHEAKHTMSRSDVLDAAVAMRKLVEKTRERDAKAKSSNKFMQVLDTIFGDISNKLGTAYMLKTDPVLNDSHSGASNGFVKDKNGVSYVQSGRGEHLRAMTDLKGFVENYLKETLPPQMKARGELDGMTEDEQIDAISDRVLEIANDRKKFKEILRNHNIIGDGESGIPNWFIEDSALGGTSRREAHRSINGFWRSTIPREQLRNYIRPGRDREQIDNPGNRDYRPVSDKWIDEILRLIVNNNNNKNAYGSLA